MIKKFSQIDLPQRRTVAAMTCLLVGFAGLALIVWYAQIPGRQGITESNWPRSSRLSCDLDRPTLVLFLHPHCPCSRSTLHEFESLLREPDLVNAYVVFESPEESGSHWERGELWDRASSISGLKITVDRTGAEARRFGALTSGHVCLYGSDGRLQFSGGITPRRGHTGENSGHWCIQSYLAIGRATTLAAPVYGCPLFASFDRQVFAEGAGE